MLFPDNLHVPAVPCKSTSETRDSHLLEMNVVQSRVKNLTTALCVRWHGGSKEELNQEDPPVLSTKMYL